MTATPEHAPPASLADVYARLAATELDEGEHPGITLHDLMAAVIEMAPEVFAAAIRKSTDAVLAEKIPAIEAAVRASERARILALAGRLKVTLTRPGNGPAQREDSEMVPLSLLRAALAGAEAPPQRVTADADGLESAGEDEETPEASAGALRLPDDAIDAAAEAIDAEYYENTRRHIERWARDIAILALEAAWPLLPALPAAEHRDPAWRPE